MNNSLSKQMEWLLLELCLTIAVAAPLKALEAESEVDASVAEENESTASASAIAEAGQTSSADQKEPPPLKPSKEPGSQGLRVAFIFGMNLFAWGGYSYNTRVTMPNGEQLQYRGTEGSSGASLFLDTAVNLPSAFRRITIGACIGSGGINTRQQRLVPEGVATPFSQRNLQADIQSRLLSGWSSVISPHIEHDIGFLGGSRVRAGYQYWKQSGGYSGNFYPFNNNRITASYDVGLNYSAHLVRLSVSHYLDLNDPDNDPNRPGQPRQSSRKSGMIRQWGVMIGTNRTIVIFAGIGPFWEFIR